MPRIASAWVAASCLLVCTKFGLMRICLSPIAANTWSSISLNDWKIFCRRSLPFTRPTEEASAGGLVQLASSAAPE
jgi:hypothetical protein